MDVTGAAGEVDGSEATAGDMSRTGQVMHARASLVNMLQDILRSSRRDSSARWTVCAKRRKVFLATTTEHAERDGGTGSQSGHTGMDHSQRLSIQTVLSIGGSFLEFHAPVRSQNASESAAEYY
jgi:hypothetical protein